MGISCCDQHVRFVRGCPPCQRRAREYRHERRRAVGKGLWDRARVTGEELARLRQHVRSLVDHPSISLRLVAATSGVGLRMVEDLQRGTYRRSVQRVNADALLATTVEMCLRRIASPHAKVDGRGVARRLQSLMADGWNEFDLSPLCGYHPATIRRHRAGRQPLVIHSTYLVYRELYDKIQSQADPSGPSPTARERAAARGFLPPECWTEETIDDPAAEPLPPPPDTEDWVETTRAIEDCLRYPQPGKAADLPRPVKREIARHAHHRLGWSWERVAELLGYKSASSAEYLLRGRRDRSHTGGSAE